MKNDYLSKVGDTFIPEMDLQDFLNKYNVQLKYLPEEERDRLEADITKEEILEALRDTNKNSAPGPS